MHCTRPAGREAGMSAARCLALDRCSPARGAGLIASTALLLAACSSSTAPEPAELTALKSPLPIQVAWRIRVGDGRRGFLQPAALENAVYAASTDGDLVRIGPGDGKQVWRVKAPTPLRAGVGSAGVVVAVAGQRGEAYAPSGAGQALLSARVASDRLPSP